MATSDVQSVSTQLKQLNEARKAVLSDPSYYSSIMGGILPLAAPNSPPELRRWATDFIAEAFATPMLPGKDKEVMSFQVMTVLRGQLENPKEDPYVLKSAIQASASIYPYVMRWMYVFLCEPTFSHRIECCILLPGYHHGTPMPFVHAVSMSSSRGILLWTDS